MEYSEMLINHIKDLCRREGNHDSPFSENVLSAAVDTGQCYPRQHKGSACPVCTRIALGFNMTLTEFLDFPELNDYTFDEDEEESNPLPF